MVEQQHGGGDGQRIWIGHWSFGGYDGDPGYGRWGDCERAMDFDGEQRPTDSTVGGAFHRGQRDLNRGGSDQSTEGAVQLFRWLEYDLQQRRCARQRGGRLHQFVDGNCNGERGRVGY